MKSFGFDMFLVVLSRNPALYSTQSIVNAARRRGHFVRVIDHMQCDLVIEKGHAQVYYQNEGINGVHAVIPRIGNSATRYGSSVVRQFESKQVFSTLNAEALLKTRDKLTCFQLLASEDIDIPKSVIANNPLVIREMLQKIKNYPKIIKLVDGTHGLGVILSENQSNAESILEAFQKFRQRIIIQEYIRESRGSDIRLFVIDDEVVGAMMRQAPPGEFRSNLHRGASAMRIEPTAKEREIAIKATRILGLQIAGVDMLRSRRGPLILEVNASPGLEGIETVTRLDIAGRMIRYVEQNAMKKKT